MQVTASAPGKVILFGEHAVVYGKPAIAVAVNKRVHVTIQKRNDSRIHVKVLGLGVSGYLELQQEVLSSQNNQGNNGILNYILKSLKKIQTLGLESKLEGLDITVDLEIPIGAGLGSSAAVTVAALVAAHSYYEMEIERDKIASYAHQVELEVQGAASPIDTALSTYGGAIYLSRDASEVVNLPLNWDIPLIIGHTKRNSNTAEMIESVRIKKEKFPSIVDPILESIEQITENARKALLRKDEKMLGELMNINHGLLDALGVSTSTLSGMVYLARKVGARGSKITGAGGGGSIIAYCPQKADEVLFKLQQMENAFSVHLSEEGFKVHSFMGVDII